MQFYDRKEELELLTQTREIAISLEVQILSYNL